MRFGGVEVPKIGGSDTGGLVTISPPANVSGGGFNLPDQVEEMRPCRLPCDPLGDDQPARVLSYGVDTFVAAVNIDWSRGEHATHGSARPALFDLLDDAKSKAVERSGEREPIVIDGPAAWGDLVANVRAFGVNGYSWLIESRYLTIKMGSWLSPMSKPSMIVEVRSEGCWRYTVKVLMLYLRRLIERHGGRVQDVKASRADLCVDVLIRDDDFHAGLEEHFVTRAVDTAQWRTSRRITGIGVGGASAPLKARLYDKPVEIQKKKGEKQWFYDVWGIEAVPENHRVIRVEFQLRRQKIKEMGVGDAEDMLSQLGNVWAYLTRKWLRVVDDPRKHHTMQHTLPWWLAVERGWFGMGEAKPVILAEPVKSERSQLVRQIVGCWSSLIAIDSDRDISELSSVDLAAEVRDLVDAAEQLEKQPWAIAAAVREKVAKYRDIGQKFRDAIRYRRILRGEALRLVSYGAATDRKTRLPDGSIEMGQQFYRRLAHDADREQAKRQQVVIPQAKPQAQPEPKRRQQPEKALFDECIQRVGYTA